MVEYVQGTEHYAYDMIGGLTPPLLRCFHESCPTFTEGLKVVMVRYYRKTHSFLRAVRGVENFSIYRDTITNRTLCTSCIFMVSGGVKYM